MHVRLRTESQSMKYGTVSLFAFGNTEQSAFTLQVSLKILEFDLSRDCGGATLRVPNGRQVGSFPVSEN